MHQAVGNILQSQSLSLKKLRSRFVDYASEGAAAVMG